MSEDNSDDLIRQVSDFRPSKQQVHISDSQRLKALEYVQLVSTMKNANSNAIRNKEFISDYELEVIDELLSRPSQKETLTDFTLKTTKK